MHEQRTRKAGSDAHLPLEVEEAQGLELHCGFSPQVWGQRAWQALQFLDPVCNSSLQSEEWRKRKCENDCSHQFDKKKHFSNTVPTLCDMFKSWKLNTCQYVLARKNRESIELINTGYFYTTAF